MYEHREADNGHFHGFNWHRRSSVRIGMYHGMYSLVLYINTYQYIYQYIPIHTNTYQYNPQDGAVRGPPSGRGRSAPPEARGSYPGVSLQPQVSHTPLLGLDGPRRCTRGAVRRGFPGRSHKSSFFAREPCDRRGAGRDSLHSQRLAAWRDPGASLKPCDFTGAAPWTHDPRCATGRAAS